MDEARRVLERLERIDRLRERGGARPVMLGEVRKLLEEGEAWIAAEPGGTERARQALEACRTSVAEAGGEPRPHAA
jgi:hypothetical protein